MTEYPGPMFPTERLVYLPISEKELERRAHAEALSASRWRKHWTELLRRQRRARQLRQRRAVLKRVPVELQDGEECIEKGCTNAHPPGRRRCWTCTKRRSRAR